RTPRRPRLPGLRPHLLETPQQPQTMILLRALMLHRRRARDYETLPARSEAMIHLAMTDLMARRLTGEATISWRDPTKAYQPQIPG
ncbi:IS5/IS1182 family transposase, partial [Streptomyces sp. NPDC001407]